MAAVENIEWLNQNLLRAYPIHEDSDTTPLTTDGVKAVGIKLPTYLITDFSFTLAFDDADGTIPSLTGVTHASDGFSLEISLGDKVLTTVSAPISTHTINTAYRVVGQGDNADCAGWVVLGDLARAAEEMPEGVYRFESGAVPFEVSTLRMAPRGVRSITAIGKYALKTYAPLFGNVKLIAGSDMIVRTDPATGAIWFEADSATGYERTAPCACGAASNKIVRTINGMSVDHVDFVGDGSCVTVEDDKGEEKRTVRIADTCSTPCCGCSELNFVESAVTTINKSIATLTAYADALKEKLTELQSNVTLTKESINSYPGAGI